MTEQVIMNTEATVDQGLNVVGAAVQAALAAKPVDAATVMALDSLRSRYIFDRLQLIRAEIIKIDNSTAMQQAIVSLKSAAKDLDDIHHNCQANTNWINKASKALGSVMDAVDTLKALG